MCGYTAVSEDGRSCCSYVCDEFLIYIIRIFMSVIKIMTIRNLMSDVIGYLL